MSVNDVVGTAAVGGSSHKSGDVTSLQSKSEIDFPANEVDNDNCGNENDGYRLATYNQYKQVR